MKSSSSAFLAAAVAVSPAAHASSPQADFLARTERLRSQQVAYTVEDIACAILDVCRLRRRTVAEKTSSVRNWATCRAGL